MRKKTKDQYFNKLKKKLNILYFYFAQYFLIYK